MRSKLIYFTNNFFKAAFSTLVRPTIKEFKRSVEDKDCGPVVKTVITRCIHCTRCVRFSTEIAGIETIGAFGRGEEIEIGTYVQSFIKTELSGNLVDLCPVGALTSKPYAYRARNWELQQVDTIDFFDAIATNITVFTRNTTKLDSKQSSVVNTISISVEGEEKIVRILPGTDTQPIHWISDRTRYAFDGIYINRLIKPIYCVDLTSQNLIGNAVRNWKNSWDSIFFSTIEKDNQPVFIIGSQSNLEIVYSINTFITILGFSSIINKYTPSFIQVDIPFFFRLNKTIHNLALNRVSGFIIIGTNLRYEASVLNTTLRNKQSNGQRSVAIVGAFSQQAYFYTHIGNSLRTLFNSLENRVSTTLKIYTSHVPIAILISTNALRNKYSYFIQNVILAVGKLFFIKTNSNDRLGYVHSNIGSLSFAHLGIYPKKFTLNSNNLYTVGIGKHILHNKGKSIVSFDTHRNISNKTKSVMRYPITTLYERSGSIFSLKGQVRSHRKTVSVQSIIYVLEVMLSVGIAKKSKAWFHWVNGLSKFNSHVSIAISPETFIYNPFRFNAFSLSQGKIVIFTQPIIDFYGQEPIADYSVTISECALFLSPKGNFILEI